MRPPHAERLRLEGPAGALEALIETPEGLDAPPVAFGVICHPHPLYGGTLDNKVVWTLARAFQELAQLLYDQAALAEGAPLANAPEYVQRLNRLLVRLAAPPGAAS